MKTIKRFIPSITLIILLIFFGRFFLKNKGLDALLDEWEMTILGFITAFAIGLFFFRKAIIK